MRSRKTFNNLVMALALSLAGLASAQTNTLSVEIGASRTSSDPITTSAKLLARGIAAVTDGAKRRLLAKHPGIQLSFPVRMNLTQNGVRMVSRSPRSPGPITLSFNTAAGFTFTATYQQFLQSVFNTIQAELTAKFGKPFTAGTILVSNYDATIDDRDAVAGGIYLPNNGSNQQEIRFPVYSANETAAVNFVHTLLLAYQGTSPYAYDAFEEGLVRAVTAQIMRENLIAGLDMGLVESVLSSTYDVQGFYDWDNQRGLACAQFIAPNLASQPIANGTNGGLYLLRYRMAGSAWSKVLTEYPTFASDFNSVVQQSGVSTSNVAGLVAAAQTVLNTDRPANPTVEGLSFSDWYRRQFILQTTTLPGAKVVTEVVPEAPDPSQTSVPDFGLFDVESTYFSTDTSGNETLLTPSSGVAYPLYLDNSFNRFSPSAQDDVMSVSLGYGSVTPNFLSSYSGGLIYRVAIDMPINDQLSRVYVPAGGVSTSSNTNTNEVFGTVSGSEPLTGDTQDVKVYVGTDLVTDAPVVNDAFGVNVASQYEAEYSIARTVEVQVWETGGAAPKMLLDRFVDKPVTGTIADGSQVGLALDLRINSDSSYALVMASGINAVGFSIDPFDSDPAKVLGADPTQLLVARYDGISGQYKLSPNVEPFEIGHGYFTQLPTSLTATVAGRLSSTEPTSVALEPGWNLIANPLNATALGSQVLVYHAADLSTPSDFTDASSAGTLLGSTFFQFTPGAADPIAGYPTSGSFTAATQFQPGQAYFVLCLAPEGLVLEFTPTSTSNLKRGVGAKRSASSLSLISWQVQAKLSDGMGSVADCVLGMARGASDGFDRSFDSLLPPSIGGLTIVSSAAQPLYRDFRAISPSASFSLSLSNLIVGRKYTLSFAPQVGSPPVISVLDPIHRTRATIPSGGKFNFTPSNTTQTFVLTTQGTSKGGTSR